MRDRKEIVARRGRLIKRIEYNEGRLKFYRGRKTPAEIKNAIRYKQLVLAQRFSLATLNWVLGEENGQDETGNL